MQKIKSFNLGNVVNILKCCLLGIVVTLVGIVVLAFVLKFVDLSSVVISYINDIIKGLAIFTTLLCVKKHNSDKLLIKSVFVGIVYALLTFIIFSILNGSFNFSLSFVYDLIFSVIVSVLITIIMNILKRKTI